MNTLTSKPQIQYQPRYDINYQNPYNMKPYPVWEEKPKDFQSIIKEKNYNLA